MNFAEPNLNQSIFNYLIRTCKAVTREVKIRRNLMAKGTKGKLVFFISTFNIWFIC
ncbi:unnamed protein product [Larinioides sclopetarius]|uniref:Uncharacterized protein n=1 Tax=Larinioides sclopetarius TaxID=280406 RepID=A0AAV1Z8K9_9ARAC